MSAGEGKPQEPEEKHAGNSPLEMPESTVYSYNLDDTKTPGGIKVKWKIRVVTGPDAARYDTRQNAAIMELLQWASRHHSHSQNRP
jgi:hypothetical protein